MRRRKQFIFAFSFAFIGLILPATAAPTAADRKDICWDDPKGSRIDYTVEEDRYLVWLMIKKHKVNISCLLNVKDAKLSELPKLTRKLFAKPDLCGEVEKAKVDKARAETVDFLLHPGEHFSVQAKSDKSKPPPDVKPENFSSYYIRCRRYTPPVMEKPVDPQEPFKFSEIKILGADLKLRKDQDSLQFNRNTDEYKMKAKGAQTSIAHDALKDEDRIDLFATVGLDFGRRALPFQDHLDPWRRMETQIIPYYRVDRVQTKPNPGKSDVDRDIVGVIGFLHVPAPGNLWDSLFSLDGQFITDRTSPTDTTNIWASTFKWKPRLGFKDLWDPTLPGGEHSLFGIMKYHIEAAAVVRYGEAFGSSNDPRFVAANTFLYGGAEVDLYFDGIKETKLEPFKVRVHYHQLYGNNAAYRTVDLFWASIAYSVDKDGDFEITLRYDKGRDYQTFVEIEGWRAGVAYKF